MEIIFLLTSIIIFLGIISGILIGKYTKDEIKSGITYLLILQKALYLIAIVIFLNMFEIDIIYKLILYFIATIIMIFQIKNQITYPALALILYIGLDNQNYIMLASTLFLIGIPTGSLIMNESKYDLIQALKKTLWYSPFLMISMILFLIN